MAFHLAVLAGFLNQEAHRLVHEAARFFDGGDEDRYVKTDTLEIDLKYWPGETGGGYTPEKIQDKAKHVFNDLKDLFTVSNLEL